MKITANTKYDLKVYMASHRVQMLRGTNPKTIMLWASIVFTLIIVNLIVQLTKYGNSLGVWIIFSVAVVLLVGYGYMFFIRPRNRYKAANKFENFQTSYVFNNEEMISTTIADEKSGTVSLKYNMMLKVMETSEYLFVFQSKNSVHVVDKSSIENGTVDEIRNVMSEVLKDNYTVCKY
jgi:hypothetical protein